MKHLAPGKSDFRESGIVQRLRKSVRELPVSRPDVLLACSGGKDSVALAWLLSELRRLDLITFSIAHIHHGQQHRADLAANAVREIGRMLDVEVSIHHLQKADIEAHEGVGLEEAMRRERYRSLARVASAEDADCIALAHHQTDQAETILLHLIRGAGVDGLAGMQAWVDRQIPWWDQGGPVVEAGLWRPLLSEAEEEIRLIAQQSGLPIVEDPTNTDTSYRRNAIRHQVLPVLESIAPGSVSSFARSAEIVAGDASLIQTVTSHTLQECLVDEGISRARLTEIDPALQSRVLRQWLQIRLPGLEVSADRIRAVMEMARINRGGSRVEIGSGNSVTLRKGVLSVC